MTASSPLALYIHWPWCAKKCPYCDFNAHTTPTIPEKEYFYSIYKDLDSFSNIISNRSLTSIFIGGGTPSLISPSTIHHFYTHINQLCDLSQTEITMEVNPSSTQSLSPYLEAGINRFSVGAQSFNVENLHFLGRQHSPYDTLSLLEQHTSKNINLNIDLMYGLPNQTLNSWSEELNKAIDLGFPHISAYQLTIEKQTHFYAQVKKGVWTPPHDDLLADFIQFTQETLCGAGYEQYEISNFAKPGFTCRHNIHVWRYQDYLGIGAGAHGRYTKNDYTYATQCYRMPNTYMTHVETKSSGLYKETPLSAKEATQEAFMSGLRLIKGIDIKIWPKHLQTSFQEEAINFKSLDKIIAAGFIIQDGTHYKLNDRGMLLLDEILNQIFV